MKLAIGANGFKGMAPRMSARALPDAMAQQALNARLVDGDLSAFRDLQPVVTLAKSAVISTIYKAYGVWLSWSAADLNAGAVAVDVARPPIGGDASGRLFITGVEGSPRVTNQAMATDDAYRGSKPVGAYPYKTVPLGIVAPVVVPAVSTSGIPSGDQVLLDVFDGSDISGWNTQILGGEGGYDNGGWSVNSGVGNPSPAFKGTSVRSNAVVLYRDFKLDSSASFRAEFDFELKVDTTDGQAQFFFLSTGATGPSLYLDCRGNVTLNEGTGSSQTYSSAPGPNDPTHIIIEGRKNDTDSYYLITVSMTTISTGVERLSFSGRAAPTGGELGFASINQTSQTDTHALWVDTIEVERTITGTGPTPVYANYVATYIDSMGNESAPSPYSALVTVDNGEVNTVTVAAPPDDQDVVTIPIYRGSTGSSSSAYLYLTEIQIAQCSVGGTANALTLTTTSAVATGTQYLFRATASNTGATTAALNGGSALPVVTETTTVITKKTTTEGVAGQRVVKMTDTADIVVGQHVINASNTVSVPNGTTVASITAGVSNTLSADIEGAGIVKGDTLRFVSVNATALVAGDILAGGSYALRNDGTQFVLCKGGVQYTDTKLSSELGEALVTTGFDPPPAGLLGLLSLPNEMMVGFVGNQLRRSAKGYAYAWPSSAAYVSTTDWPIVAIAAFDTVVLVLTTANPYTAYGDNPDEFSMTKELEAAGCVSKRSVASFSGGVVYASSNGLYRYSGQGRLELLTRLLFTRSQWQALNPLSVFGIAHDQRYYFFYDTGTQKGGYVLDMAPDGFGLVSLDFHATAGYVDPQTGVLHLTVNNTNVVQSWDDGGGDPRPYQYRSKLFMVPPTAFQVAKVKALDYDDIRLKIYSAGTLWVDRPVTSPREFVLPPPPAVGPDNIPTRVEIEVSGTSAVQTVEITQDMSELS